MNKYQAVNQVIELARSHLGYHEGYNNNNPFAVDPEVIKAYGGSVNNLPWCDIFYDYLFCHAFGAENAKKMTYQQQDMSAACKRSYENYKTRGAVVAVPQVGDQIFFYSGGDINHTGIVETFNGDEITTIEGNSSDAVMRRSYGVYDRSIAGYGRPNWDIVATEVIVTEKPKEEKTNPVTEFFNKVFGKKEPEPEKEETVLPLFTGTVPTMNGRHALLTTALEGYEVEAVKAFQVLHNFRFDAQLPIDGNYTDKVKEACQFVQNAYGLEDDGECGAETFLALIMGR